MEARLLAGSSVRRLATNLSECLGIPQLEAHIERFLDGECHVRIEDHVRGRPVLLVQSTSPPVGQNLVELLLLSDACRRAGASSIVGVIPYFGYARQDRRARPGDALGSRVMADALASAGVARAVMLDLHSPPLEAAFAFPVDHVEAVTSPWKELRDTAVQRHVVRLGRAPPPASVVFEPPRDRGEGVSHGNVGVFVLVGRMRLARHDDLRARHGDIHAKVEEVPLAMPQVASLHHYPAAIGPCSSKARACSTTAPRSWSSR